MPKYWGKWKNYKFDIIKLDRRFFYGENGFTDRSKETVKSIIDLAYKLHKAVVAEEKRKLWLISWRLPNVILFRGYYYAKPLAKDDFLKLIKAKASNS